MTFVKFGEMEGQKMHPEMRVIKLSMENELKMEDFFEAMDALNDATKEYSQKLSVELEVSVKTADQIQYIRSRSRWSQELEDRIITASKAGFEIDCLSGEEEEQLTELGF